METVFIILLAAAALAVRFWAGYEYARYLDELPPQERARWSRLTHEAV